MPVRRYASIGLVLPGITLIILGVMRGEVAYVFQKAVNVCFECIGLA